MKIITFSNLHLEFGIDFKLPENSSADVMDLLQHNGMCRGFEPKGANTPPPLFLKRTFQVWL